MQPRNKRGQSRILTKVKHAVAVVLLNRRGRLLFPRLDADLNNGPVRMRGKACGLEPLVHVGKFLRQPGAFTQESIRNAPQVAAFPKTSLGSAADAK